MNFGSKMSELQQGFQIAPMLDVVFLLLIFFMSTSIFYQLESELGITIPTASEAAPMKRTPGEIIINIDKDGTLTVNQRVVTLEQLGGILKRVRSFSEDQAVIIRGDRKTHLERAIDVLNTCAAADIWNVSFAAIKEERKENEG